MPTGEINRPASRVREWIMTERVILISASVALEAIIWIIIALTCPVH